MSHTRTSGRANTQETLYHSNIFSVLLITSLVVGGVFYASTPDHENPFIINHVFARNESTDVAEPTETPEATEIPEPTEVPESTETPEPSEIPETKEAKENETSSDREDADVKDGTKNNETTETITNADGSTTVVTTKTEDDGKMKVTRLTVDLEGNEVREVIETKDNDKKEVSIKSKSVDGTKYEYKKEDGSVAKLDIEKMAEGVESKVKYNSENDEFEVDVNDSNSNKLKIKFNNDVFKLTRSGVNTLTNFPIVVNEESGTVSVTTSNGTIALKQMPDSIVEKATGDDNLDTVESVDLKENENNKLTYVVKGNKSEKLLGLVAVKIPLILNYDPTSGSLLKTSQSIVSRVLDLFSF